LPRVFGRCANLFHREPPSFYEYFQITRALALQALHDAAERSGAPPPSAHKPARAPSAAAASGRQSSFAARVRERTARRKEPLKRLQCANRSPPKVSWYERVAFPERWLCQIRVWVELRQRALRLLGITPLTAAEETSAKRDAAAKEPAEEAAALVRVTAAPEPDEVLWTNLECARPSRP
jgi:aromatic ring-cleaving dioxygenase